MVAAVPGGAGETGVVRVRDEHLPALTQFFRRTWDPDATIAGVRQARADLALANPHGPSDVPTFLFMRGGEAVGHVGTIPIRLLTGGKIHDAHWLKGLMVLPEFQGGPVGFLLVKEAARALGWAMALVVRPEARKLFTALGFKDRGALRDSLRVLDAPAITTMDFSKLGLGGTAARMTSVLTTLQRLRLAGAMGYAAGGMLELWSAVAGRGTGTVTSGSIDSLGDAALDQLWARCAPALDSAPVRDARYLRVRYRSDAYLAAMVHDANGPSALAIVRRPRPEGDPRLAGVRVATLSDLLAVDESSALAVIAAAERLARAARAQALLCGASHQRVDPWLRRRGFVPLGGSVHLLVRGPDAATVPAPLERWWLLRGDSDADEVF